MKKITKKFLNMLFAYYSKPFKTVCPLNGDVSHSHHNEFARFSFVASECGNAILYASTDRLPLSASFFVSNLLALGFKKYGKYGIHWGYYLKVQMAIEEVENWARLLLSDDKRNLDIAYYNATFVFGLGCQFGVGRYDKQNALFDMRANVATFLQQGKDKKAKKQTFTEKEAHLLLEHYVRLYNLQSEFEKMDYLCTLLE